MNGPNPIRHDGITYNLSIVVHGEPIPQGSAKAYNIRGRAIVTHDNQRLRPWREAVKQAALDVYGTNQNPMDGPIDISIWFTVPKPKSAPKRKKTWPTRRPDLDKLCRGILDALKDAGVYKDDSQVIRLCAYKHYVSDQGGVVLRSPGAVISLGRVEN